LDRNRLRHATPEAQEARMDIARRLRDQSQQDGEPAEEVEEQRSRRARLTGRLRDTFRIRTRTENAPNATI
jgi:hypothetical protein